jgi:hypothetical protein
MRLELWIVAITIFFITNSYYDNYFLKLYKSNQKYLQMAFYGFLGLTIYLLFKRNPNKSKELLTQAHTFLKYLPIDKTAMGFVNPILSTCDNDNITGVQKIMSSGIGNGITKQKRCVSESKKKYVAAQQNWKCGNCREQLPAWFEIDHTVRLEHGGSNHVDNLVALCRECHGKKTMMENFS